MHSYETDDKLTPKIMDVAFTFTESVQEVVKRLADSVFYGD